MSFIVAMQKSPEQVFVEFLKENGMSMTPQRKVIVETFLDTEGHFTAEQLYMLVRQKAPDVGQATVYRALRLLVDSGLADSMDTGDGGALYEHAYGHDHHDHLICVVCDKKVEIFDAAIERRQEEVAEAHGFELTRHRMLLFGVCAECATKKQ